MITRLETRPAGAIFQAGENHETVTVFGWCRRRCDRLSDYGTGIRSGNPASRVDSAASVLEVTEARMKEVVDRAQASAKAVAAP
jgi:hypothetical protein